jgi:hypothetical protein
MKNLRSTAQIRSRPAACNIVTLSFAEFVSFSRSLISKESKVFRVLPNHNRVFEDYAGDRCVAAKRANSRYAYWQLEFRGE